MSEESRKLLIVEDDPGLLSQLKWCFEGYEVFTAEDRESAIVELRRHEPTVVLQDLGLPPKPESVEEGLLTLTETLKLAPHTKVIVVTGNGDQENALTAVAQGAYDFYEKPVDTDTLKLLVDRAFSISELELENRKLQSQFNESPLDGIVASSEGMLAVCRMIEKVAPTDVTALLLGESGTGKELLARALHRLSPRSENNFVAINCAAIPENLLESELFGHEKGAFTGAHKQTLGKIELADGGTLFLDEIGELQGELQAKLLRVLQTGDFERLGGSQTLHANARLIAATNKNLESAVDDGDFRADLYYRISSFPVKLPPLRDRPEDIPALIEFLVGKHAKRMGKDIQSISARTIRYLTNQKWPGNVRELEGIIQRALISTTGPVLDYAESDGAEPESSTSSDAVPTDESADLRAVERQHILKVLENTRWVIDGKRGAASKMGVAPSTLRSKMKRLGIKRTK